MSFEIWPNMPYGDRPVVGPVMNTWGDKSLEWCVERIGECGYEGFDVVYPKFQEIPDKHLDKTAKRLKEIQGSYGMEFSSIGAHFLALSPRKWDVDAGLCSFKKAVDIAAKFEAETVVSFLRGGYYNPPLYVLLPWDKAWDITVNVHKEAAKYAEDRGVNISMEPHQESFVNDIDLTLELIKAIDADNLYVCLDVGTLYVQIKPHMSVEEAIKKLGDRLNVVHCKDIVGGIGKWNMVWFGGGNVNFREVGNALRSINYGHYVSVEWEGWFGPQRGEYGGPGLNDFDRVAKEAKIFLEKML